METIIQKKALISGASIAGLALAYWLHKLGYGVTVVEQAPTPRVGGAAVNLQGDALVSARRMGILPQLEANQLQLERLEFKNADDVTENALAMVNGQPPLPGETQETQEIEIERDKLVGILVEAIQGNVEWVFSDRVTALAETPDALHVTFAHGAPQAFDLVLGCDGLHSGVRKIWFGHEDEYVHFLAHYFSLTIVNDLLVAPNTMQLYNMPGKMVMLNAYKNKTDIVFCFFSEKEISCDYRDTRQQREIVLSQFADEGWRTPELLKKVAQAEISYFDKICQVKMPAWTKGRVALVGDAAYCASPAAGIGASLALAGAAAVAQALANHPDDFAEAFRAYDDQLRPFITETQETAATMLHTYFVPKTEAAIRARNSQPFPG